MRKWLSFLATYIVFITASNAQEVPKGWHLMDPIKDSFYGIGLNKTYDFLKDRQSKTVIVAVIDGGVDTTHEDLKNVLWKNTREIAGNGKDDDGNGYVDDVYGWNFLGGKDGSNVKKTSSEVARVYYKYKGKYNLKSINEDSLSADEKEEYELWKKAEKEIQGNPEDQVELMFMEIALKTAKKNDQVLREEMKQEVYNGIELEKFQPQTMQGKQAKMGFLTFIRLLELEKDEKNTSLINELQEYVDKKKEEQEEKHTPPANVRGEIVKDNYNDINDRFYGNNDVMGPDPMHGTHVSGIIGAQRGNGIGIDGVAGNVKIMTVRAVPDGDEYDKDIALAIRYAVDNGAKVINMSFGKSFSPEKKWVDDAVKYAESKDVLLVHAAGNEAENVDEKENYPNAELKTLHEKANNFITVGASSDPHIKGSLVADFSNYGKHNVDVFAPGVKIYSTVPGGNTYGNLQGTSMASPIVAGLAALIRSYFPGLTATQVKMSIEKSIDPMEGALEVKKPGTKEKVMFADLCATGGIINAYNAVKVAAALEQQQQVPSRINNKPKREGMPLKKKQTPNTSFKNLKVAQ